MAGRPARLPKWQISKCCATENILYLAQNYICIFLDFSLALADNECRMTTPQGRKGIMNTFENINSILNAMADEGILEHMAEPCDFSDAHPLDWAEVAGIVDEVCDSIYPESVEA